jgi:hypothetical protein
MRREIKKELDVYMSLLSEKQQQLVLDMVKNILNIGADEKRIDIERYNAEIESALHDVQKGNGISHKEVVKQSKKWLKRK